MAQARGSYWNRYTILTLLAFLSVTVLFLTGSSQNGHGSDNKESQNGISPSASSYTAGSRQRAITTDDVLNGKYYARGANCSWIPDGTRLSWIAGNTGDLVTYDVGSSSTSGEVDSTSRKSVIIKSTQFLSRPWKTRFSGDGKFVLVAFEPKRLFRFTYVARYAVHSATTGQLLHTLKVEANSAPSSSPSSQTPETFQLATWSNDNRTILLVHKNDVHAVQIDDSGAVSSRVRLTNDGSDVVFNGVADWVYEEELFTSSSASVFSSSGGEFVAYLKFNDSEVEPVSYTLYGDYSQEPYFDEYFQYPKFGSVRYPKSGTSNPIVSVHVVKLGERECWDGASNGGASSCQWEFEVGEMMNGILYGGRSTREEFLLGSFKWVGKSTFMMNVLNRVQNKSWILECDVDGNSGARSRSCVLVKANSQVRGWIDNFGVYKFKGEYFTVMSVGRADGLEYGGVLGISKDVSRVVTVGEYTVDEIVGVFDWEGKDVLIFKSGLIGSKQGNDGGDGELINLDSTQTHYYAFDLTSRSSNPVCLTCYSDCTYNTGKFSAGGDTFVNTCERENRVTRVELIRVLRGKGETDGVGRPEVVMVLESNIGLQKKLEGVALPEVEYGRIPYRIGGSNYSLSYKVVGPRGWKEESERTYPLIVDIYGGPNSQKVTKRFSPNDWSYALASKGTNRDAVYLSIDGVGSGRQSNSLAFEVWRDLGDKEIFDKIYAVKWFLNARSSIDPGRTLIWGWSYGGYVSAMIMGKDKDKVLKCGVSVAPVVNWHYYDTIYTERYMSTPDDNPAGYNTSNVLRYMDGFRGKDYLLVHGNADDNVHYQQSMVLARGLEQANILFRMQSYPDENHSLGSVRPHLYATLEDFVFNQCFAKRENSIK